ncbi:MAG: hypothetical protein R3F49_10965 [Planctomycetota bacterium]
MSRLSLTLPWCLLAAQGAAPAATAPAYASPQAEDALELIARAGRGFSGVFPHLASFNGSNECGTGALVPWAGKLWWVTYAPHAPRGSDDRLYAMDAAGDLYAARASIGGTPANRMVHAESQQLFIGPYAIDAEGRVRVIPYERMPGRPTGNARHLTEPAHKLYYATMEEGLYEVDVDTLAVTTLFTDTQFDGAAPRADLPGYHGKGLYSGQGVVVYSNNGEYGERALTRPDTPSGVLAEWRGEGPFTVVQRNQFTEVTGPGGIHGGAEGDPLWSVGWDHRSLLLMSRSAKDGAWHRHRLPKPSHAYDGAHGWNTEWPRIRDIGEDALLMTMHGALWSFPRRFGLDTTAGVRPRSAYLAVVGDFCKHGRFVVFGKDDAARSEFLNQRRAKGALAGPAESQSNLWFLSPGELSHLGPALGHGGVFVDEEVTAGAPSDPFLVGGYDVVGVHLAHDADGPVTFTIRHAQGDTDSDRFEFTEIEVAEPESVEVERYVFRALTPLRDALDLGSASDADWVTVSASRDARVTVWFELRQSDPRTAAVSSRFASLAPLGGPALGGLLRAGDRARGLQVLATRVADRASAPTGYYELRPNLSLVHVDAPGPDAGATWMAEHVALPRGVVTVDAASALYVDDDGRRWRVPVGNEAYFAQPDLVDLQRASREVVTERDLFQCAGTFFELPARNAGGFAKVRPIATHPLFVQDYCSWRGLLALTGLREAADGDPRVIRSADGRCAVWLGAVDDLWTLGKPRGIGGPWAATLVRAGEPSDPYLMTGYDEKAVTFTHDRPETVRFTLEVDITGTGAWYALTTCDAPPGSPFMYAFPPSFAAYWVRVVADHDCVATARFTYR